jgi:hypothetical protein
MTREIHAEKNEVGLDLPVVFMATNDSERDLEVPRTGTVAKLRKQLGSLTSPDTWPDGLGMQFVIASPWGPSLSLMPRTCVAAALLGQVGWDDPGVMAVSSPTCPSISLIIRLANIITVTKSLCPNCGAHFPDDAQVIEAAFTDTDTDHTSNLNLDDESVWVEVIYHPGMVYRCVMTQVIQIARAAFGQVPTVPGIDVLQGDIQWRANWNHPVIIPNEGTLTIAVYCTFTAPVRGI